MDDARERIEAWRIVYNAHRAPPLTRSSDTERVCTETSWKKDVRSSESLAPNRPSIGAVSLFHRSGVVWKRRGRGRKSESMWRSREIPYLLTILMAVVAWSVQRIVDRATALPLVSYEIKSNIEGIPAQALVVPSCVEGAKTTAVRVWLVRFHNLSGTAFLNTDFIFQALGPNPHILAVRWTDIPPADAGGVPNNRCSPPGAESESLHLQEFQPDWSGIARVWAFNATAITVMHHFSDLAAGSAHPAMRLMESGLTTAIVEHEFGLYACLAVAAILMIVLFLWLVPKSKGDE